VSVTAILGSADEEIGYSDSFKKQPGLQLLHAIQAVLLPPGLNWGVDE